MTANVKELRRRSIRLKREEEDEEGEIGVYCRRLAYMLDGCSEYDRDICGLLEEQQGMLNALCMYKREFQEKIAGALTC